MSSRRFEIGVGALVLILAAALLVFGLQSRQALGEAGYTLYAEFSDASGIRPGTVVEISGVPVGRVTSVELNEIYFATVALEINAGVVIPEDSELAWRQSDLLGAPRLSIIVFDAFGEPMGEGDVFSSVDPADNFFELLSNLAAGGADG